MLCSFRRRSRRGDFLSSPASFRFAGADKQLRDSATRQTPDFRYTIRAALATRLRGWKSVQSIPAMRGPGGKNVLTAMGFRTVGKSVPRYYFSLDDGKFLDDVDGTHLSDRATALLHAERLARDLVKRRRSGDDNWWRTRSVVVVDERGHVVCTVPLRVSAQDSG